MQVQRHLAAICASIFVVVTMGSGNAQQVPTYAYHSYEKYKTVAHFRAFTITSLWKRYGVSFYYYRAPTVERAIDRALNNCQKWAMDGKSAATSFDCKLHSIGNIFVYGMNDEELQTAIKLYKVNRNATNKDLVGFVPGDSSIESATTPAVKDFYDIKLCKFALAGNKTRWETRPVYLPHVEEAKRRGLTIKGCRSKLGLVPSTQVAALPEPSIVVNKDEIENDDNLKTVIKRYFNDKKFMVSKWGGRTIQMLDIENLSIKSVSESTFMVNIKYRYGDDGVSGSSGIGGIENGTLKIKKTSTSYEVIRFDRKK